MSPVAPPSTIPGSVTSRRTLLSRLSKPSDNADPGAQVFLLSWASAWATVVMSGLVATLIATSFLTVPNLRRASQLNGEAAAQTWVGVGLLLASLLAFSYLARPSRWPVHGYGLAHMFVLIGAAMLFIAVPVAGIVAINGIPPVMSDLALPRMRGLPHWLRFIFLALLSGSIASLAAQIPPLGGDSRMAYSWSATSSSIILASILVLMTVLHYLYWYWIWDHATDALIDETYERLDVEPNRVKAAFDELIHNGVVRTLERFAANHPVSDDDRSQASALAAQLRNSLLSDPHPRSVEQLLNGAVDQARRLNIVLHLLPYIEAEPPSPVVRAVGEALSYLISNLQHAGVDEAQLAVSASNIELAVTLRDNGVGFGGARWSKETTSGRRVSDALGLVGATGTVESTIGVGTTYCIVWHERA